jgi:eukaryotic-like serine/threonine-protein kinase
MAPEQIRGELPDRRSDVFSLGIILHEMLTGHHPYQRRTYIETAASMLNDEPLPLMGQSDRIPPRLMDILSRMLEKNPSRRLQSMREVGEELGRLSVKDPLLRRLPKSVRSALAGYTALIFTLVVLAMQILL